MRLKNMFGKLLSIASALAAFGLLSSPTIAAPGDPIKIGVSIRMISDVGFKQGKMIEDEVATINAAGGIKGRKVELTLLNDECKPAQGVDNANKLIYQEKVHLVIGSSCSSVTLPIVDVTAEGRTPQITPHSTNPTITQKGSAWIFRVPVSGRFYKAVQAEYVAKNIGKKVAYIYASDAAGQAFAKDMIKYMKDEYKVSPVFEAQVQEKEIDFRALLLKAKAANPDALVLSALQDESARALIQSYEVGISRKVKRVLNSVASKQETPELAGKAIRGVFYAAAFSADDRRPIARRFVRRVQKDYGVLPDHDFSQAWDMMQIIKQSLERASLKGGNRNLVSDRRAIRDSLAKTRNYRGLASGPINFCAAATPQCRDGNRTPVLIEYTRGGKNFRTRVLDSVTFPASFGL